MEAVPLSRFVADAITRGAYNAPSNVAEDAVRRTAIDLCERAGIWTFNYPLYLQTNVADYPLLELPEHSRVVAIDSVRMNNRTYKPQPGDTCSCQCGSMNIFMPDANTIIISPASNYGCDVAQLKLWLAPTLEACELPEFIWQEYSDTIAEGASSRLMQMPAQAWTNQGLSQKQYAMYQVLVTRAKNKRVLERTTGSMRMRGEYF